MSDRDVLQAVYDAWNRGDIDAAVEWAHPDAEFRPSGDFPGMQAVYRGHDELRRIWEDLAGPFESLKMRMHEITELGEGRLLSLYTFVARGRDGVTAEREAAQIVSVEGGLLRSMRTFGSWEEARAEAFETDEGGGGASSPQ